MTQGDYLLLKTSGAAAIFSSISMASGAIFIPSPRTFIVELLSKFLGTIYVLGLFLYFTFRTVDIELPSKEAADPLLLGLVTCPIGEFSSVRAGIIFPIEAS